MGELYRDGKFNANETHWLVSEIEDQLYLQMCECNKTITVKSSEAPYTELNRYYYEAHKYAGFRSAGNYEGKNAKCKPRFKLYLEDFSARLKAELAGLDSRDKVITRAVFRIFRSHCKFCKLAFYQYIENEPLEWEFV